MSRDRFFSAFKLAAVLGALLLPTLVSAQGNIRISRPLDGATVRETVSILVPASDVPAGGFVAFDVDGHFRCASSERVRNGAYFLFAWDTKSTDPDTTRPEEERKPREGKHTITAQAYNTIGLKSGSPVTITVYVKNSAASDMPAKGLRLAYSYKVGTTTKYRCKRTLDVLSISGDTTVGQSGAMKDGVSCIVARNVVDQMSSGTALIRNKVVGDFVKIDKGVSAVDRSRKFKSLYMIEDLLGNCVSKIQSTQPGTAVQIGMLRLPSKRVRIGDVWNTNGPILTDILTGETAKLKASNTLEGLEWENGYPCAKIRTTFTGTVKVPGSKVVEKPIAVNGEIISYFAYRVGKLVSSEVVARGDATVDSAALANLKSGSSLGNSGLSLPGGISSIPGLPAGGSAGGGLMGGMIGSGGSVGIPGLPTGGSTGGGLMGGMIGGGSNPMMPRSYGSTASAAEEKPKTVDISIQVIEKLELSK